MIVGIGVDLCKFERIESLSRDERFLNKLFTEEEISYAMSRKFPARHLASAFCAKEAFSKACGLGMARMGFKGVGLHRNENGAPFVKLDFSNPLLVPYGDCRVFVSVSHDHEYAVATVIIERD